MDLNNSGGSPLLQLEEGAEFVLSDEEQEQEDQVPPVSTYLSRAKYWFRQFRFPICVLLGNLLCYGLSHHLMIKSFVLYDQILYDSVPNDQEGTTNNDENQMPSLLGTGSIAIMACIFLMDCYICLKGAQKMEKRVREEQEGDDGQGTERPSGTVPTSDNAEPSSTSTEAGSNSSIPNEDFDFVEMSKSVDAAFSCGSGSASATFLVCLLYAIYTISVWKAVDATGTLVYTQFLPQMKKLTVLSCHFNGYFWRNYDDNNEKFGVTALQQSPEFEFLPTDIQAWIKQHKESLGEPSSFNRSLPYIQDADGSLVFPFIKKVTVHDSRFGDISFQSEKAGLAVHSATNNDSVVEYMATEPKDVFSSIDPSLTLIGFPEDPPFTGWCAVFEFSHSPFLQDETICYNSNSSTLKHFLPVVDEQKFYGASGSNDMYASNDTLWVIVRRELDRKMIFHVRDNTKRDVMITLTAINVVTMEKELAAGVNLTRHVGPGSYTNTVNPSCRTSYGISVSTSAVALILVAVYLYRLDVPSCVLPVCLAVAMVLTAAVPSKNLVFPLMLLLACICLYLLATKKEGGASWKYISMEMMVWGLYSALFSSSVGFWSRFQGWMFLNDIFNHQMGHDVLAPFFILSVAAAIGLLLKHPIFEILGACTAFLASIGLLLVFFGLRYLLISALLFLLSLGCFRAGSLLNVYRVHLIVYARRIWRFFRTVCCCKACVRGR